MLYKKYDPENPAVHGLYVSIGQLGKGVLSQRSRVFIRGRLVSLAWYPLRGICSQVELGPRGNRFLDIAVGPLYLKIGPGIPTP